MAPVFEATTRELSTHSRSRAATATGCNCHRASGFCCNDNNMSENRFFRRGRLSVSSRRCRARRGGCTTVGHRPSGSTKADGSTMEGRAVRPVDATDHVDGPRLCPRRRTRARRDRPDLQRGPPLGAGAPRGAHGAALRYTRAAAAGAPATSSGVARRPPTSAGTVIPAHDVHDPKVPRLARQHGVAVFDVARWPIRSSTRRRSRGTDHLACSEQEANVLLLSLLLGLVADGEPCCSVTVVTLSG